MFSSMISRQILTIFIPILFWCVAQVTAQQPTLQDVPPPPSLGTVPESLEPSRRASLERAIKARDYQNAEKLLVEEIERNPKSPQLLTLLGSIFFLDGEFLNSAIAIKKAEALGPLDESSRFTLAMAYVVLKRRDWARPELSKLVEANQRNPLYVYWLARLDFDDQQFSPAVEKLLKVLELDPGFMKAYDNLGLCYEALGKHEEAIHSYEVAVRLNREKGSGSPWPTLNLGTLLLKLGRIDEAESYLRESLSYNATFAQARYQLGVLLEKQKKYPEAIQELSQAATSDPSSPEPHYALARIYRQLGDSKSAEVALSRFRKLKKDKRPDGPQLDP